MKKIHILAIIMLCLAGFLFVSTTKGLTTYGSFADAKKSTGVIKLVGQLAKDKPMSYNPTVDPNYFSFFLKDQEGIQKKVVINRPKPQDFERAEQIVLTGQIEKDDVFYASDILTKCPSKYKDEELQLREQKG